MATSHLTAPTTAHSLNQTPATNLSIDDIHGKSGDGEEKVMESRQQIGKENSTSLLIAPLHLPFPAAPSTSPQHSGEEQKITGSLNQHQATTNHQSTAAPVPLTGAPPPSGQTTGIATHPGGPSPGAGILGPGPSLATNAPRTALSSKDPTSDQVVLHVREDGVVATEPDTTAVTNMTRHCTRLPSVQQRDTSTKHDKTREVSKRALAAPECASDHLKRLKLLHAYRAILQSDTSAKHDNIHEERSRGI
ncbi:ammonium transporter 2 [Striga asiatica]|uniref:Ammonium transporter 2 n=1 Tax=Striga asiatica TaxID=4170 RepID=A0A5A7PZT4_STRAF|nr:ammonium transporter 2 [Striga asiatica]